MRLIVVLACLLFSSNLSSQIGVSARYGNMNPAYWESVSSTELFNQHYEFGIDYWLRLKNYRVEFMPEFYLATSNSLSNQDEYNFFAYGLIINTNFYIFDFEGDCDCPTFSKEGGFFSKGFFLSVAPLLEYQLKSGDITSEDSFVKDHQLNFGASIGAGLDLGVFDLITITPFVRMKLLPFSNWNGFNIVHGSSDQDKNEIINYAQFGVRLGFRLDYVKEQKMYKSPNRKKKKRRR